jgi:hypothetical protein
LHSKNKKEAVEINNPIKIVFLMYLCTFLLNLNSEIVNPKLFTNSSSL